jgi:hypothetical protein
MGDDARFRMELDEKTQIIRQWVEGPMDEEDSARITAEVVELKKKLREPDKVRILAVSEKPAKPTPGARRHFMENARRNDLYKVAFLGKNPYMKTAMSFLLMVSGLKKIRVFSDEKEAIEWLSA